MKHNLSIVLALGAALLLAPACSKEKKSGDEASTEAKTAATAAGETQAALDNAGAAGANRPVAGAPDILAHMPADTEIIVSFSMQSLSSSPLWSQIGPAAMASAGKELGQVQEACGFNPLEKLQGVYIGVNTQKEKEPVLLVQGFEREEMSSCITAMAKKDGKKVTLTQEGAFTMVVSEDADENMTIAWPGGNTMIMVPGQGNKEFLQDRMDGKDGLKGNAAFVASAAKAKQSAPIWFAAAFKSGSPVAQGMGAMGQTPTGLYGSVGLTKGLDFDMGVSFADAAAATATLNMAKPFLGMAKSQLGSNADLVDKLKMETAGADLVLSISLSEADLEKLQAMAGPMMGSFGK